MTLYGGLSISPSIEKVGAASSVSGSYAPSKVTASDEGTHMPEYPSTVGGGYSTEGYTQPKKEQDTAPQKEEDDGFYIPTFDDNGTPHWTEPDPPQSQGKLDVGKLLEGQTEGYRLYSDGEGGFTQDPNSKGGIYFGENALAPKSTAPKTKKQTATAALPEVSSIYTMDGDDYSFDTNAFATAQRGTGEDQAAMSIAGGSGGGSKRNSNVNDAVFGGQSNKATPGYSLW